MQTKPRAFNLTPKRIEALKFIQAHPDCFVGYVAENVLAKRRVDGSHRPMWSQAATRSGAGYCKALEKEGLVTLYTWVDYGFGKVTITAKGVRAILDSDSLAAVVARSIEE